MGRRRGCLLARLGEFTEYYRRIEGLEAALSKGGVDISSSKGLVPCWPEEFEEVTLCNTAETLTASDMLIESLTIILSERGEAADVERL